MGGVFTHLAIATLSAGFNYRFLRKLDMALALFVGNLLPDAIKFGLTAIRQRTFNVVGVTQDASYWHLAGITGNVGNWMIVFACIVGTTWMLYHFHKIKKRTYTEYKYIVLWMLIGVFTHLLVDIAIEEQFWWL